MRSAPVFGPKDELVTRLQDEYESSIDEKVASYPPRFLQFPTPEVLSPHHTTL